VDRVLVLRTLRLTRREGEGAEDLSPGVLVATGRLIGQGLDHPPLDAWYWLGLKGIFTGPYRDLCR